MADTHELGKAETTWWEAYVELRRPKKRARGSTTPHHHSSQSSSSRHHDPDSADPQDEEDEDWCEDGLHAPNSALDGCHKNFTAADGERTKASTAYYADTGIMAILCRHDLVLFWVNMTHAGERQFYALALMDELMKHLPWWWKVGILYDIGCQTHRSVVMWGFLDHWDGRLVFAISVFHAYGHQWICQIWYHPKKQRIWGLSDGEGCERLWSMLRHLIRLLRVCGVSQSLSYSFLSTFQ